MSKERQFNVKINIPRLFSGEIRKRWVDNPKEKGNEESKQEEEWVRKEEEGEKESEQN